LKNREELSLDLDRGPTQTRLGFDPKTEPTDAQGILRPESTGPAHSDQPALTPSEAYASDTALPDNNVLSGDALMELILHRSNLDRAWQRVKRNRGAPGPDGITIKEFEPGSNALALGAGTVT